MRLPAKHYQNKMQSEPLYVCNLRVRTITISVAVEQCITIESRLFLLSYAFINYLYILYRLCFILL